MSPRVHQIDSLLTIGEVCELIHIHINTARRWSNAGLLPTVRVGKLGHRRYLREDITNLVVQLKDNRGDISKSN